MGHHKKTIKFLMGYLLIFAIVMIISFINLSKGAVPFDIGMNPTLQNWVIIGFSALAILKVLFEIVEIEIPQ